MVDSIYRWSLTASSNDAIDSIINWRENQLPSTVNDSARAMMQRLAEFREDLTGSLLTTGTQPSYVLQTNAQFDTLTNGRFITARIHATNAAGASSLNVNNLGALSVRKFGVTGDMPIAVGDLQAGGLYQFMYSSQANAGAGGWIIPNPSIATGGGFASGTALLFPMANSPSGWTKQTAQNDKAIRVVSGTTGGTAGGGAQSFSQCFSSTRTVTGTVDGHALSAAEMPVHAHTQQGTFTTGNVSNDHTHTWSGSANTGGRSTGHTHTNASDGNNFVTAGGTLGSGSGLGYKQTAGTNYDDRDHIHGVSMSGTTSGISANHTHQVTLTGATANAGSGTAHVHTFTSAATDFAVQYLDVILATKD